MGTWNYRVARLQDEFAEGDQAYGIVEAYYDDDGNIEGRTESAMTPRGETMTELRLDLVRMMQATRKPVMEP